SAHRSFIRTESPLSDSRTRLKKDHGYVCPHVGSVQDNKLSHQLRIGGIFRTIQAEDNVAGDNYRNTWSV
ncbi:hypothetical protein CDAR_7521, partial [Caerostris darwini]